MKFRENQGLSKFGRKIGKIYNSKGPFAGYKLRILNNKNVESKFSETCEFVKVIDGGLGRLSWADGDKNLKVCWVFSGFIEE
jgi:hypothetical protein